MCLHKLPSVRNEGNANEEKAIYRGSHNNVTMKHLITTILVLLIALHFKAQQNASLIDSLQDVIKTDPSNWKAMSRLAAVYKEQSNTFQTLNYLRMAMKIHESDTLKRELALCYYNRGYYKESIVLCESILAPDTLEKDLVLLTKSLRKVGGDATVKLLHYEDVLFDRNPMNWSNTMNLAQDYISLAASLKDKSLVNVALEKLEAYTSVDSSNLNINGLKAKALYLANRYEDAIVECHRLIKMGSQSPMTYYFLGLSYKEDFNVWKGIEYLQIACDMTDNAEPTFVTQLGLAQLKVDSLANQGIANLNLSVELQQPDPAALFSIYYNIGEYYFSHGYRNPANMRSAIAYYTKAKDLGKYERQMTHKIIECYHHLNDTKMELKHLEQYLSLTDDSMEMIYIKNNIMKLRQELFMRGELKEQSKR